MTQALTTGGMRESFKFSAVAEDVELVAWRDRAPTTVPAASSGMRRPPIAAWDGRGDPPQRTSDGRVLSRNLTPGDFLNTVYL